MAQSTVIWPISSTVWPDPNRAQAWADSKHVAGRAWADHLARRTARPDQLLTAGTVSARYQEICGT